MTDRFLPALLNEIALRSEEITEDVDTLYIGGGTPSVLPLSSVESIFSAVSSASGRRSRDKAFREFTVEVNPEDIVTKGAGYASGLEHLGVNRISMGVQSFDDRLLKWMNRRHDSSAALSAYRILRDAGFANISIDLIFGISHMDDELWRKTVETAIGLHPEHISAYQLSVEPGSALAGMVKTGRYAEAAEDVCRRQYDMLCRMLADAGYRHYEISNFSLPGFEAVHNSAYWRHVPYAGFGPGAHSFSAGRTAGIPEGVSGNIRSWNLPDVRKYVSGGLESFRRYEVLTGGQMSMEKIMLGLRTDSGVEAEYLKQHSDAHRLETLLSEGMLVCAEDPAFLRIPENQFFISDSIIADIV